MKRFTFAKLSKLGDFDEKYGQRYWGEPNEQLVPVSFNSMNQDITQEDTIEAEEILLKTSKKGTEYHQLKKVKVVTGEKVPMTTVVGEVAPHTTTPSQLDRIEAKLDRLLETAPKEDFNQDIEHLESIGREEY